MNKRNYQKELEKVLDDEANRGKKLFLHSCCAPCSSYVLTYLASFFDITVFYYNPNITASEEYEHRVKEQKRLIDALNEEFGYNIKVIEGDHDVDSFYRVSLGLEKEPEGGKRCVQCFKLRLEETYKRAIENGADFFCSTLTISPLKNAALINTIGEMIAGVKGAYEEAGALEKQISPDVKTPKWLLSDFKKKDGYKESVLLSNKYDLYRQDFCGCEFSKEESLLRTASKTT